MTANINSQKEQLSLNWYKCLKTVKLLKKFWLILRSNGKDICLLMCGKDTGDSAYINGGRKMIRQGEMSLWGKVEYLFVHLIIVYFKYNLQFSVNTRFFQEENGEPGIFPFGTMVLWYKVEKPGEKCCIRFRLQSPPYYTVKFPSKIPLAQLSWNTT